MADFLQNKAIQKLVKLLKLPLPTPVTLRRNKKPILPNELQQYTIYLYAPSDTPLTLALRDNLIKQGVFCTHYADTFDALVYDATAACSIDDMKPLYTFLHNNIKRVAESGRVVILSSLPQSNASAEQVALSAAFSGFVRALAKEVGGKGITAQLLQVEANVLAVESLYSTHILPVVQFLLSPRSAYISGQVWQIRDHVAQIAPRLPENKPLSSKIALITGGAQGIGAATARVLAREGAKVLIVDIPQATEVGKSLAKTIKGVFFPLDITADDAPQQLQTWVLQQGGVDILVNNAGITRDKTLGNMPETSWNEVLAVNLKAAIRLTEALLQQGLHNGGAIISLASISGIAGNFGQTNYSASKAGIIGFSQSLAITTQQRGITVNAVAPGFIETKMTASIPLVMKEVARRMSSLKQGGLPQDVAETICFLATAKGISGQTIRVCGGNLIGA